MRWVRRIFFIVSSLAITAPVTAGMPAPLPTPFTKESYPHVVALDTWLDERLQALSFFIVVMLACAAGVQWLWNLARHDWPVLPILSYQRSLAFTLLWGMAAMVVLTMISGARELMTPGAWRKQGWTYKLEEPSSTQPHFRALRRAGLEQLRVAVLQYAAINQGVFPASKEVVSADWSIPAHPGFEFLRRPDVKPSSAGELYIFEPELGDEERFVLLSNGMIGTMRTPEIEAAMMTEMP